MPKYMALFSFKGEALAQLVKNPQDREAVIRTFFEGAGGTLEAYYVMFGQYDGFVIGNAPDSLDAAAVSIAASRSGAFSHIETHEVLTSRQFQEVLGRAKYLPFLPPGG